MPVTDTHYWEDPMDPAEAPEPVFVRIPASSDIYRGRLIPWRRYVYRDAITGKFVTKAYAKANPATTYRDRIH